MAFTNFDTKEINCKIIYFGPAGSGKTANLRSIYTNTSPELRSGMLELDQPKDGPKFFDFLPVSLGQIRGFHLKLHLFTMPENPLYETLPGVILKGVDGYVFVADSRIESMAANFESLAAMRRILTEEGNNPTDMARVFQYNKRDLKDIVSLEIMRQELNVTGANDHEAVALKHLGTMETLQSIAKQVMKKLT